jgi:hypothetical protein
MAVDFSNMLLSLSVDMNHDFEAGVVLTVSDRVPFLIPLFYATIRFRRSNAISEAGIFKLA